MKLVLYLALGLLLFLPCGCARDFEAPPPKPPQVILESVEPDAGFAGDVVVLCGTNLTDPPSGPQVTIQGVAAEIVADPDGALNPGCTGERLGIRLPIVGDPGPAPITVTTQHSQATLDEVPVDPEEPEKTRPALVYLGPGHPQSDDLDSTITIRSTPQAVAAVPVYIGEEPIDWLALASSEARMIHLVEADTSLPFGFGICSTPISIALDVTQVRPPEDGEEGWEIDFRAFATMVTLDSGEEGFRPVLKMSDATFTRNGEEPGMVVASEPAEIQQLPTIPNTYDQDRPATLAPWRIWPLCRFPNPGEGCANPELVVSHADLPGLAIAPISDPEAGFGLAPPATPPTDPPSDPAWACGPPKSVTDVVYHADDQQDALWVLLSPGDTDTPGSEIWRFDLIPGSTPARIWPPETEDQALLADFCGLALGAMAKRRISGSNHDDARIYAADYQSSTILEFRHIPGRPDLEPIRYNVLPAPAFALASGRFKYTDPNGLEAVGEFLYAFTQRGIWAFNISQITDPQEGDPWELLPLVEARELADDMRGTSQSLTVIKGFAPNDPARPADRLVLADAHNDQWYRWEAGASLASLQSVPLVNALPQITPSRLVDGFWLADPNISKLRLVDRRTDVQRLQLKPNPGKHLAGFASGQLSMTSLDGQEILILAQPAAHQPDPERLLHDKIILLVLPGMPEGDSCANEPEIISYEPDEAFHDLIWLVGRETCIQLVRYAYKDDQGDTVEGRKVELTFDLPETVKNRIPEVTLEHEGLSSQLQAMRVSPRHHIQARVLLENTLVVQILDPAVDNQVPVETYAVPEELAAFATSLIGIKAGSRSQPVYLLAIPLTHLGELMLVAFEPGAEQPADRVRERRIVTGGMPLAVFSSPDERRLYATHMLEDKVSLLTVDCSPLPRCAEVVRTVSVSTRPAEVHFDPSGSQAYVNHLFNNAISVFR